MTEGSAALPSLSRDSYLPRQAIMLQCADRTLKLITGPRALSEPSRFEPVTALYVAICIKNFCICCTACLFMKLSLACNLPLSIRDELFRNGQVLMYVCSTLLFWIVSKWKLQLSPFRTFLSLSSSIWINCFEASWLADILVYLWCHPCWQAWCFLDCLIVYRCLTCVGIWVSLPVPHASHSSW